MIFVNLIRGLVVLFWLALAFTLGMALLAALSKALLIGGDKTLRVTAFVALTLLARLAFRRRRLIELFAALAGVKTAPRAALAPVLGGFFTGRNPLRQRPDLPYIWQPKDWF